MFRTSIFAKSIDVIIIAGTLTAVNLTGSLQNACKSRQEARRRVRCYWMTSGTPKSTWGIFLGTEMDPAPGTTFSCRRGAKQRSHEPCLEAVAFHSTIKFKPVSGNTATSLDANQTRTVLTLSL